MDLNTIIMIAALAALVLVALLYFRLRISYKTLENTYKKETHWYISMLDAIPFPISVTDKNMNWTFINKPVENMLNTTREKCIGVPCSKWGAKICNTKDCGIKCLKSGALETFFEQAGSDFQVNVNYLYDENKQLAGHIEVVQDISKMMEISKKQEKLIKSAEELSQKLVVLASNSADSAQKLAGGANEQSASVEELVATVAEIAEQTKTNSISLKASTEQTDYAATEIRQSNNKMSSLITAMKEIDENSQKIRMIITTIEDIASQTNLLSLNASIEAARAGEAGRGFAVVADEIGKLAGQSSQAAKDTKDLIETTIKAITNGSHITDDTAKSLGTAMDTMLKVRDSSIEINKAISDQAVIIEQVNQGLGSIADIIQDNSKVAGQSSETSMHLSNQAHELKDLISK